MSMVINTNIQATRTHNVYSRNNAAMNEALTRVATGLKINSAKDGAANWAISEKMRERIRANDQANQNVQNDTALLKTAQGGIGNTIDILKTLKERAINAMNDSNINDNRSAIATEVYQLVEQIDDNAAKVKFNGRQLLNGAEDTTVGTLNGASAASESTAITAPTAANVNTPQGSHAAFGLYTGDLKDKDGTAVSGTTLLKNFADLEEGDVITFSWKEDGEAKQKSIQVNNSNAFSDLTFTESNLYLNSVTAGTALTYGASENVKKSDGTTNLTAVDAAGASAAGIFAVGAKNVNISDFAVSVTYKDYDNDAAATTRTEAQSALEFTGIQQAKEATNGSHSVFRVDTLTAASAAKVETTTALSGLYFNGGSTAAGATDFKITFGDGTEETFSLTAAKTIADLQTAFAAKGITVTLGNNFSSGGSPTAENNQNALLKDSENVQVTQNTLDDPVNLKYATTAEKSSLYFVGEAGVSIKSIDAYTSGTTTANANFGTIERLQIAKAEEETTTGTASAASTPLYFHVAGESDFGINVTIDKMTSDNLLVEKYDDGTIKNTYTSQTFGELFLDKDTAKTALGVIENALNTALNEQTKLGAIESRLGYTSDNITTMNENLEAADSVMRDSDIAKEMTNYMKYSVLAQASQYMLAQSSQNAFSVLNLLQA